MLAVGDRAPEFALPDARGDVVRLADFRGRPLVVYFYPKDQTLGCTIEACTFRDRYESLTGAGAEVVGISSDDSTSHASFARRNGLPFRLLADASGEVRRAFGVPKTLGLLPGRATFVLDGDGIVRYAYNSQFTPAAHAANALAALRVIDSTAASR